MSNQTDLEKKIEEAAENFKLSDISYPPLKNIFKAGCKHGYTLGREEMLQELLEYMRKTGDRFLECADGERQSIGRHWHIRADAIESKFKGSDNNKQKEGQ